MLFFVIVDERSIYHNFCIVLYRCLWMSYVVGITCRHTVNLCKMLFSFHSQAIITAINLEQKHKVTMKYTFECIDINNNSVFHTQPLIKVNNQLKSFSTTMLFMYVSMGNGHPSAMKCILMFMEMLVAKTIQPNNSHLLLPFHVFFLALFWCYVLL